MTTRLLTERAQELGFLLSKNQTEYSELQRGRSTLQKGLALQRNLENKLAELRKAMTELRTNLTRLEATISHRQAQTSTQRRAHNKADAEWASSLYKKAVTPPRIYTSLPQGELEGLWGVDHDDYDGGVYSLSGVLPERVPMGKPGVEFQLATHPRTGENCCVHHDGLLTYLSGEVIGYDPEWADSFDRPQPGPHQHGMGGVNVLF